jgi:hypothetical protein
MIGTVYHVERPGDPELSALADGHGVRARGGLNERNFGPFWRTTPVGRPRRKRHVTI